MTKNLLTLIFVSLTVYSFGQSPKEQLKIANAANVGLTDFYEEISFTDRGGYFIIPVTIGSQTYDYIFDTGGYNTVTTDIMTKNNLPELMKVTVGSGNKIKSKITLSKVPQLNLGNISFTNVGVFNFDFHESPLIMCYTNGGLIGKGIIRQSVWQIDYEKKIIRLADKVDKMPNLENSLKLKVELDKTFNPFIQVEIDGRNQKFLLDFGYGGFIALTEKTANEYDFVTTFETYGEGVIEANGPTNEPLFISPLTSVKLAGHNLNNQMTHYSKSTNYNLIGSEISKYFIVTLNFKDKGLILTPRKNFSADSFKSFGIDLNLGEKDIYISRIYKGLDGEKVGIQLKDKVISVNEVTVDSINLCDSFFKLRKTLHQADSLEIKIIRNGIEKEFKLEKTELR
jgi:hypothetical protein